MVSVQRDYSRALLFDPIVESRQVVTEHLAGNRFRQSVAHKKHLLRDTERSVHLFQVEHITLADAGHIAGLPDYELPGIVVVVLHSHRIHDFKGAVEQLADARQVPRVVVVEEGVRKGNTKVEKSLHYALDCGFQGIFEWTGSEEHENLRGGDCLCARLQDLVHRVKQVDNAYSDVFEKHLNNVVTPKSEKSHSAGNAAKGADKSPQGGDKRISDTSVRVIKAALGLETTPGPEARGRRRKASSVEELTEVAAASREADQGKSGQLFKFRKTGWHIDRRLLASTTRNADKKRWHRRHSLTSKELEKLGLKVPQLSDNIKLKLKGAASKAKKRVQEMAPVLKPRDALQPDFVEVEPPPQRSSKADSLTWAGCEYYRQQQFRPAVRQLCHAIHAEPEHFYALFYRGLCYCVVGRYRKAIADFVNAQRALRSMKGRVSPIRIRELRFALSFNLALCKLNSHQHGAALAELKISEQVDPLNPTIPLLRGFIRRRRGLYAVSRGDYVHAAHLQLRKKYGASGARREEIRLAAASQQHRTEFRMLMTEPKRQSQILTYLSSLQRALMTPSEMRSEMHLHYIAVMFQPHAFFKKMKPAQQLQLCRLCNYHTLEAGEWVFRRGDKAHSFYVVLSGELNVMIQQPGMLVETTAGTLIGGDTFGELGLMEGSSGSRSASIYVHQAAELVSVDAAAFDSLGIHVLMDAVLEDKREAIRNSGVFRELPPSYLESAARFATIKEFGQGERLVRQGQHATCFFIMLRGICAVQQRLDMREELVRKRKKAASVVDNFERQYTYHHQVLYHSPPGSPPRRPGELPLAEQQAEEKRHHLKDVSKSIRAIDQARLDAVKGLSWLQRAVAKQKEKEKPKPSVRLRELMPPHYFGESAIRTDDALEHADVVAVTRVKVLRVFASQLDFSDVSEDFLERLARGSAVCPLHQEALARKQQGLKGWKSYKKETMLDVNKSKWPLRNALIQELPGGLQELVPKPKPHGEI